MTKQLYVIEYENAHWCGGGLHCLVWAEDGHSAEIEASYFMEDAQRELFSGEISEEMEVNEHFEDECMYSIVSVNLAETSEDWEFIQMPDQQAAFYPVVNGDLEGPY